MLLVAYLANTKPCKKLKPLAHGYLSERTQRELFNEYQHDRFRWFQNLCVPVLWKKEPSALEGLNITKTLVASKFENMKVFDLAEEYYFQYLSNENVF